MNKGDSSCCWISHLFQA